MLAFITTLWLFPLEEEEKEEETENYQSKWQNQDKVDNFVVKSMKHISLVYAYESSSSSPLNGNVVKLC